MNLKLNRKIVKEMAKNGLKFVEDCSPTILTGLVAAGVLTSVADARPDDEGRIALADGNVRARVTSVEAADNLNVDAADPAN